MRNKVFAVSLIGLLLCGQAWAAKGFTAIGNGGVGFSADRYFNLGGVHRAKTTEAQAQMKLNKSGGTFSSAYCRVSANTNGNNATLTLREDGANTAIAISITASTTGNFEDTDEETVVVNALMNWAITSTWTASLTIEFAAVAFSPSTEAFYHNWISGDGGHFSSTSYPHINGFNGTDTLESSSQFNVKAAGTWSNLSFYLSANSAADTETMRSRKNSANGNQVVSITASSTGRFDDTTNSDTLSVGDDINWEASATSGGNTTLQSLNSCFTPTTESEFQAISGATSGASIGNATWYDPIGARINTQETTEANSNIKIGYGYTATDLQINVSANTGGSTVTFDLRRDTGGGPASTSLAISITASSTGYFEDTDSVSLTANDKIGFRVVGPTSGSTTYRHLSVQLDGGAHTASAVASRRLIQVS